MLDVLETFLCWHGHSYLRLDGGTPPGDRQRLMDRFNSDTSIFCFVLSTRSGGLGVNLTGADTVIFYDSDWNPQNDIQALARCHRIGQTKEVSVYRLLTRGTYEGEMFKAATKKLAQHWQETVGPAAGSAMKAGVSAVAAPSKSWRTATKMLAFYLKETTGTAPGSARRAPRSKSPKARALSMRTTAWRTLMLLKAVTRGAPSP